jgi:hypothetical protein
MQASMQASQRFGASSGSFPVAEPREEEVKVEVGQVEGVEKNCLEQFVNDIKTHFYSETPVSTVINLNISTDTLNQEPFRRELISLLNKKTIFAHKNVEVNFYGENGLYISRTAYSDLVKNILIKKAVSDFRKKYPNYKVFYIVSKIHNYGFFLD